MLLEISGRTSSTATASSAASAATLKVRTGDVSQCFGYGRLYLLRDGGIVILFRITRFFAGRFARVIRIVGVPLPLVELLFSGLNKLGYFAFSEFQFRL